MNIVLAVDGSAASEAVVANTVARPWPPSAEFEVLTVADGASLRSSQTADEVDRLAREVAQQAAQRLSDVGLNASPCVLSAGDPRATILRHLTEHSADCVIVGAHASGIEGFRLGSVAKALLRHSPCAVEIARPSKPPIANHREYRVLLATDGSEGAEGAARSIAGFAWPPETRLRIVSAVELTTTLAQAFEPPFLASEAMEEVRSHAMLRAQNAIGIAREIMSHVNLPTSESISVLLLKPAEIILDEAGRYGADLIVVGSHGRRGWNRWWLGSVSEAVAMHAECSVRVVRPRAPFEGS